MTSSSQQPSASNPLSQEVQTTFRVGHTRRLIAQLHPQIGLPYTIKSNKVTDSERTDLQFPKRWICHDLSH